MISYENFSLSVKVVNFARCHIIYLPYLRVSEPAVFHTMITAFTGHNVSISCVKPFVVTRYI